MPTSVRHNGSDVDDAVTLEKLLIHSIEGQTCVYHLEKLARAYPIYKLQ
jgi:hypothetical protein